jgi:hypothetical protein
MGLPSAAVIATGDEIETASSLALILRRNRHRSTRELVIGQHVK